MTVTAQKAGKGKADKVEGAKVVDNQKVTNGALPENLAEKVKRDEARIAAEDAKKGIVHNPTTTTVPKNGASAEEKKDSGLNPAGVASAATATPAKVDEKRDRSKAAVAAALAKNGAPAEEKKGIGHKKDATPADEKAKNGVEALAEVSPAVNGTGAQRPLTRKEKQAAKKAERDSKKAEAKKKREEANNATKAERQTLRAEREARKTTRSEAMQGIEGVPVQGPDWRIWITVQLTAMQEQLNRIEAALAGPEAKK